MSCLNQNCPPLTVDNIQSLVSSPMVHLTCLDISNNNLAKEYIAVLAQGRWPQLSSLFVGGNDNSAVHELGNTDWKSLRVLD